MKSNTSKQAAILLAALGAVSSASAVNTLDLTGTVRDFKGRNEVGGHPDFQYTVDGLHTGAVLTTLPGDKKPDLDPADANTGSFTTAANFDQWYTDVAVVNLSTPLTITLTETAPASGVYSYENNAFFPIDNQLFGNTPGQGHNYHFTFELNSSFTYQAGQVFTFTGDDDLWVYINNQLAIDLGGVHGGVSGSVSLDTLGLTAGQDYDLDLFFAERHTSESNFRIETSIRTLRSNPVVPEPGTVLAGAGIAGLAAFGVRRRLRARA